VCEGIIHRFHEKRATKLVAVREVKIGIVPRDRAFRNIDARLSIAVWYREVGAESQVDSKRDVASAGTAT
jgi:hypothetical protein